MNIDTSKESQKLVFGWVYKAAIIFLCVIGFLIKDKLTAMDRMRLEAAEDRKELRSEIGNLKEIGARTDERYLNIEKSLEEIKNKLNE